MLDVLVARIAPGLHPRLEAGIDLLFQLQLLGHRLDDQIGGANALAVEIGNQPVERVADIRALAHDLAEQIGRALHRAGDRLRLHVRQRRPKSLVGAPGRDVAAHGAGADHMDML